MARMAEILARGGTIMSDRRGAMIMLCGPLGAKRRRGRIGMAGKDRGERHQQGEAAGEPTRAAKS